jgi:hypothetical protein
MKQQIQNDRFSLKFIELQAAIALVRMPLFRIWQPVRGAPFQHLIGPNAVIQRDASPRLIYEANQGEQQ